jgi:hypothetical protein
MIRPNININGSSKDDLINPRIKAMGHLMDAIEALRQTAPNGRDYIGDRDQCDHDRDLHFHRLEDLKTTHAELMAEALYIKEQGNA